jgi:hypothetical protein
MSADRWVGRGRAAAVVLVIATGACAGKRDPEMVPTPSVHELARLQHAGQLDRNRLECVMVAAGPLASEIRTASRVFRNLLQTRGASVGRDHARSVQQAMAGSDEANLAARAAQEARRAAQQASLEGDDTRAAHFTSYAAGLLSPARDPDGLPPRTLHSSQRGAALTDEEADLFVEYAELRASLVSDEPSEERISRVQEIEALSPVVMDLYAGLLLDLYGDHEVTCAGGGL